MRKGPVSCAMRHCCSQSQHRQAALLQPITAQTSGTVAANHSTDKWHCCRAQTSGTVAANHSTDKWHCCSQSQHRQVALLQPITAQTSGTAVANHSTDKWHCCSQSQHRQVALLQPISHRLRCPICKTNRFKNSFMPVAVRLLNNT